MQVKQKVTLYLSPELHRRLKIRSAIDSEPMSELAQRAIVFYLAHPEVVEEVQASYGQNHQVYACPECTAPVVLKAGQMVSLSNQPTLLEENELSVEPVVTQEGEEELVPC